MLLVTYVDNRASKPEPRNPAALHQPPAAVRFKLGELNLMTGSQTEQRPSGHLVVRPVPTPAHFKGGAQRHCKVMRDNIRGITKPANRRLARRRGVKRISGILYEDTRGVRKVFPLPPDHRSSCRNHYLPMKGWRSSALGQ